MTIMLLDEIENYTEETYEPTLCPEYEQAWIAIDGAYHAMTAAPGLLSREALQAARSEVWYALDIAERDEYPASVVDALREALSLFEEWK